MAWPVVTTRAAGTGRNAASAGGYGDGMPWPVPSLVRAASVVRGRRVLHPRGTTLSGVLTVTGGDTGAELLDRPGRHDVLVRLSRSAGLPAPLPDVHGVAVRVLDCYGPGAH